VRGRFPCATRRVSRATGVAPLRNYISDEGRPLGAVLQGKAPNHPELRG
jgi:hypothetical protein